MGLSNCPKFASRFSLDDCTLEESSVQRFSVTYAQRQLCSKSPKAPDPLIWHEFALRVAIWAGRLRLDLDS